MSLRFFSIGCLLSSAIEPSNGFTCFHFTLLSIEVKLETHKGPKIPLKCLCTCVKSQAQLTWGSSADLFSVFCASSKVWLLLHPAQI